MGVWLDVAGISPASLSLVAPRAQVFVQAEPSTVPRASGNFYFLKINANAPPTDLGTRDDGVWVENATPTLLAALRERVSPPRLLVAEIELQATETAALFLEHADGICFCNFLREEDTPLDTFKTEAAWKRAVDALATLTSDPDAQVYTATRFSGDAAKNPEEMQLWLDYTAASFLLGASNSHVFFGFQGKAAQEFLDAPIIAAQPGVPVGAMYKANGVYQRRFTDGLVLVNPTLQARSFALPRNYTDLDGVRMTGVSLPPVSGRILFNVK
jgi:hypothetical protein